MLGALNVKWGLLRDCEIFANLPLKLYKTHSVSQGPSTSQFASFYVLRKYLQIVQSSGDSDPIKLLNGTLSSLMVEHQTTLLRSTEYLQRKNIMSCEF